jgi:uncharacterized protein YdbL (DUF1318 family)
MIRPMKRILSAFSLLALAAACVTVNIYFPAAEVKRDAERIVNDVYGELEEGEKEQRKQPGSEQESSLIEYLAGLLGPAEARAQDVTATSNAAIRGLKRNISQNLQQLAPYLNQGNVGIDKNGYLVLRDTGGMAVSDVGKVKKLIARDKNLRDQLYAEVARARNTDQVDKVRAIFADMWRSQAKPGWYVQQDNGSWTRK